MESFDTMFEKAGIVDATSMNKNVKKYKSFLFTLFKDILINSNCVIFYFTWNSFLEGCHSTEESPFTCCQEQNVD